MGPRIYRLRKEDAVRTTVLVVASAILVLPFVIPLATGSLPRYEGQTDQFFEEKTVSIDWTAISGAPHANGTPPPLIACFVVFNFGAVRFSFSCYTAESVWVVEQCGGNYGANLPGNGTWISPDGLSGVGYYGGTTVTLLTSVAGVVYSLPILQGWAAFAGSVGFFALAITFYRLRLPRGPTRIEPPE
jgi:hypothetical protein